MIRMRREIIAQICEREGWLKVHGERLSKTRSGRLELGSLEMELQELREELRARERLESLKRWDSSTGEELERQIDWLKARRETLQSELEEFAAAQALCEDTQAQLRDIEAELVCLEQVLREKEGPATAPFAYLRLEGTRFDEHGVPPAVWEELPNLEALCRSLVRHVYLRRHRRKRLPRHFQQRYGFQVRRILEGSAIPVIERVIPRGQQGDLEQLASLDEARTWLLDTLTSLAEGKDLSKEFPLDALQYLKKLGQHLHDGESMSLVTPDSTKSICYNRDLRRQVLARLGKDAIEEDWEGDGIVTGLKNTPKVFYLSEDGKGAVEVPYTKRFWSELEEAYRRHRSVGVRLRGIAVYDPVLKVSKIKQLNGLELVDYGFDYRGELEMLADELTADLVVRVRRVVEATVDDYYMPAPKLSLNDNALVVTWSWEGVDVSVVWRDGRCWLSCDAVEYSIDEAEIAERIATLINEAEGAPDEAN